ncbi:MAG: 3'(2'),5'-bisphosphate nucleotidase CysQ, partial [Acidimicrobiales bacterium]
MPDATDHRLAVRLAHDAGRLLVGLRARLVADGAPAGALKAEGDRRAHELLVAGLAEARPGDAVLSEEGRDDPGRLAAER